MAKKPAVSNDFKLTEAITIDGRKIEKVLKAGNKVKNKGDRYKKATKAQKAQIDAIYSSAQTIYNAKPSKGTASLKYKSLASIKDKELHEKVIKAITVIVKAY